MKIIAIVFLLTCSIVSYSQSQADSLAIMNLIQRDYDTYSTLDTEAHRKNCTSDYVLIENGERLSLEQEIGYMKSLSKKASRKNQFDHVVMKVKGNFAYVIYELKSVVTRDGATKNYQWTESVILNRESTGWKLALIHSTKVKEW